MKQAVLFHLFASLALVSAFLAVRLRNAFHSALFLIAALTAVAGIFLTLDAELLAGLQVLISVGAVSVLILFAIMLTRRLYDRRIPAFNGQQATAAVLLSALLLPGLYLLYAVRWPSDWNKSLPLAELAGPLLREFALPFELISVLLLAACVGAVYLARREEK
jgi:NADH-quinone oxidoreductase subunit J